MAVDEEREREDERRGQQPGADIGDDRDVPEDPLLPPPSEDEPAQAAESEEPGREDEERHRS
jgi:hypothetical protein